MVGNKLQKVNKQLSFQLPWTLLSELYKYLFDVYSLTRWTQKATNLRPWQLEIKHVSVCSLEIINDYNVPPNTGGGDCGITLLLGCISVLGMLLHMIKGHHWQEPKSTLFKGDTRGLEELYSAGCWIQGPSVQLSAVVSFFFRESFSSWLAL